MSLIRVVSQNIRGLRDSKKRKEVFHYFNIKKFDIIMLQETHSNVEVERVWRAEWGNSIFYAHGTTAARGTCILIKNSCTHVKHNVSSDENGRYLILDITISSERYTLASIYAPNEDHPEFFHFWREMNPDIQKYTWHKNNPTPVFCRLDYFLASFNLYGNIKKMEIKASYKSDHSIILTEILLNNHRRGRGFWKLNCSLLEDKNYVEKIKTTIRSAVEENSGADPQLLLDTVKCRIRGTSIAYATFKKKQEDNTSLELEFQLDKYAKKYESKSDPEILAKN